MRLLACSEPGTLAIHLQESNVMVSAVGECARFGPNPRRFYKSGRIFLQLALEGVLRERSGSVCLNVPLRPGPQA